MVGGAMVVSMEQGQQHLEPMGCDTDQYNFFSIPSFSDPVHISFDFAQQVNCLSLVLTMSYRGKFFPFLIFP